MWNICVHCVLVRTIAWNCKTLYTHNVEMSSLGSKSLGQRSQLFSPWWQLCFECLCEGMCWSDIRKILGENGIYFFWPLVMDIIAWPWLHGRQADCDIYKWNTLMRWTSLCSFGTRAPMKAITAAPAYAACFFFYLLETIEPHLCVWLDWESSWWWWKD